MFKFGIARIGTMITGTVLALFLLTFEPSVNAVDQIPNREQQLSKLQIKEKRLNTELGNIKDTSPESAVLTQSIMEELLDVQNQIKNLSTGESDASTTTPPSPSVPSTLSAEKAPLPEKLPIQDMPTNLLPSVPTPKGAANGVDFFRKIREDLTLQLRQIQQMLRTVQPQDERLSLLLQEEQKYLLEQLRQVNQQILSTGAEAAGTNLPESDVLPRKSLPQDIVPIPQQGVDVPKVIPQKFPQGPLPEQGDSLDDQPSDRNQKVETAARLLRESGLVELSDQVLLFAAQHESGQAGNFGWAANTPVGNPLAEPAPEFVELKKMISDLQKENEKLTAELSSITTQLKLISHKLVASDTPFETKRAEAPVPDKVQKTNSEK